MYQGKFTILRNTITACDYSFITKLILDAVRDNKSLLISPIASHTLVKAYYEPRLQKTLAQFDHLLPDSHWVKVAIGFLYGIPLKNRVYGPKLMVDVCQVAEIHNIPIFLYGTTDRIQHALQRNLLHTFCRLTLYGQPSYFRPLKADEKKELLSLFLRYKPRIIFVGLGSPLQEEFALWLSEALRGKHNAVIIPVGAAFEFIAQTKPQAPHWVGQLGFEWLFRLVSEPTRLWRRYLIDGTQFIFLMLRQKVHSLK